MSASRAQPTRPRSREGIHPLARTLVEPLLSLTLAPTMIEASAKRNVIPAVCDVVVDCRLQPGQQPEDVEPLIREVLGAEDYELTWIERWGGTRSPAAGPLWEAVRGFVSSIEPAAGVIALGAAGFTDSHWLREAFGTVAYGFFPMRTMDPRSRRCSCTPPTSECTSTISPSVSTSCATRHRRSARLRRPACAEN